MLAHLKREPCDANTLRVQYYQQNDTYKALLHYMNTTLTGLFTLECIMKIFSFGFRVTMPTMATTNTMPMPTMPTNTMPSTATSKNNCKETLELEGAINNLVPVKNMPHLSCPVQRSKMIVRRWERAGLVLCQVNIVRSFHELPWVSSPGVCLFLRHILFLFLN